VIDVRNYSAAETLKDGSPVTVRAIRAQDRQGVLDAFGELDRDSVYTRFFSFKKGLTDAEFRSKAEFGDQPFLIPASVRRDADAIDAWAPAQSGGRLVVACYDGGALSQGVAAREFPLRLQN
jgi:hypothetical protein